MKIKGEKDVTIEQYCRCNDGSYGLDCDNLFSNPCDGQSQFFSSPPSVSDRYYIQCAHKLPNLFKCPAYLEWNEIILTCAGKSGNNDQIPYLSKYMNKKVKKN